MSYVEQTFVETKLKCSSIVCVLKKSTSTVHTYEGSNSTAYSSGKIFLYNSKGLDVISLLVKYYVPLAHINKVINRVTVLGFLLIVAK